MFSSIWHYSTNFWFLFPELPLTIFESQNLPHCLCHRCHWCFSCHSLYLQTHWCLADAGVTAVIGVIAMVTIMSDSSLISVFTWVTGTTHPRGGLGSSQGHRCLCHIYPVGLSGATTSAGMTWVVGSSATVVQFPVALVATVSRGQSRMYCL